MQTRFGDVAIAKSNVFSTPVLGSRTSPYLQAKLVLLGAEHVYAHVPPLVASLLGIVVSTSQVYRRVQAAAATLPATALDAPCPVVSARPGPVYGMVDGSMLFTDSGWQEVKVGRVFQPGGQPGGQPGPSQYVAQRGPFATFARRFEQVLPPDAQAEQVFVTDSAPWIHHWLNASYPRATLILDFYHVAEKLAAFAQAAGLAARPICPPLSRPEPGRRTGPGPTAWRPRAAGRPTRDLPAHEPRPPALRPVPPTRATLRQRPHRGSTPHPAPGPPQT